MHIPILYLLFAAVAFVTADDSLQLVRRQTFTPIPCSQQGKKDCGTGCISISDTCCPDRTGGCPFGSFCDLGTNGEYGCCPNGKRCTGAGGVITSIGIITSTRSVLIPAVSTRPIPTPTPIAVPVPTSIVDIVPTSILQSTPNLIATSPTTSRTSTTPRASTPSLDVGNSPTTTGPAQVPISGASNTNVQGVMLGLLAFVRLFFIM